MPFRGIDQHARQVTVSPHDQQKDVLLARQVSTGPDKVLEFFDQFTRRFARSEKLFITLAEAYEFNGWYRCHKVILVHLKNVNAARPIAVMLQP